jgi:hypothetical protein
MEKAQRYPQACWQTYLTAAIGRTVQPPLARRGRAIQRAATARKGGDAMSRRIRGPGKRVTLAILEAATALLRLARAIAELIQTL